ncbi:hypothetical protein BCV72DRAFT_109965 [Rhizopus microsporus var. microsporus]|nr:hypothetical protein BCV72DRAFT_109965 [Rhizopus microsporus var. microsporus]
MISLSNCDYQSFTGDPLPATRIAETVNEHTVAQKQSMYAHSEHSITGHKVDNKLLLVDRHGQQEINVCTVEAARNSADDHKLTNDHNKLLQEGKDTLKLLRSMNFCAKNQGQEASA